MTKAELEETIRRLCELGDALAETLESLHDDATAGAYLKQHWPHSWDAIPVERAAWDDAVGDMQRAGIVGPFSKPGDVEFEEPG